MKIKLIALTIITQILILNGNVIFGQEKSVDILYLKTGNAVRGQILEHIPSQTIKIQTSDGSIMVYKTSECDSIKKETVYPNNEKAINNFFLGEVVGFIWHNKYTEGKIIKLKKKIVTVETIGMLGMNIKLDLYYHELKKIK